MKTRNHDATAIDPDRVALPPAARWTLASLSLSMLLSALGTSIANVGLPTLADAFGATFGQVQWVVLVYLLAITTMIVIVGRLGDTFGRRRVLLGGIGLFALASVLCGLAPSLPWLIAARALQGVGAAIMMALTLAFVGDVVPKARTGSAMGLLGTMSAVGTAMGPSLGGMLIAGFGWPAMFFINLPLGLMAWWFAHRFLPAQAVPVSPTSARFDPWGMVLLALTLAAYALAVTVGGPRFGALNLVLLVAAAAAGYVFLRSQARAAAPLLPLAHLRDTTLRAGFAMGALVTTIVMATMVVGPFHLAGALALDPAHVGLVMTCGPLAAALSGVPAGRLVDRLGGQRMAVAALALMVVGAAAMALLPARLGVAGYVVPLIAITAGYAVFQTANNTTVMGHAGPGMRGVVSGLLNLSRNLGLITGASVMGALYASGVAWNTPQLARIDALRAGMQLTFAVASGLALVSLAIALAGAVRPARADTGHADAAAPAR